MMFAIRRLIAATFLSVLFFSTQAQPGDLPVTPENVKEAKPYKVLTNGKQVTIKSTKDIDHVMLWTSRGNRVVEQKEINAATFTFKVPVNDKFYFLMVGLEGGKIYTEKIGVR